MKTKSTLLLALALGLSSISTASAGLITDPLSVQAPVIDQGLTTDPLGNDGPKPHVIPPSSAPVNVAAASSFLAEVLGSLPADGTLRLSNLFLNPEFFAAAHAAGPEADALRGQIDWFMLTGVILGLDGDDGLDDLTGDAGDDFSSDSAEHNPNLVATPAPLGFSFGSTQALGFSEGVSNMGFSFGTTQTLQRPAAPTDGIILGGPGNDNIILGGPGNDNILPQMNAATLAPFNPSIILGGPGNDNIQPLVLAPFNPSIILGGPGNDNIILGGPGNDNIILGGPGNDNIILGGPENDNLK